MDKKHAKKFFDTVEFIELEAYAKFMGIDISKIEEKKIREKLYVEYVKKVEAGEIIAEEE